MTAYYNEIDSYCVQWLKNLIAEGLIAPGDVDDRPIQEVKPDDLKGYTQCHFFAGIAGWSYALRLAGWDDDRPVWTGSCPCQPFSSAGLKQGASDERHLWPAFFELISELRPPAIFGEQVAGKLGVEWVTAVRLDLEALGYACGIADLPAASVGSPQKRQRLFWVADARNGNSARVEKSENDDPKHEKEKRSYGKPGGSSSIDNISLCDPHESGLQRREYEFGERSGKFSAWEGVSFVRCFDGKARPVKPGIFPMANGVPGRVGKLRAYGNAIVPQVAAVFIKSFMEVEK